MPEVYHTQALPTAAQAGWLLYSWSTIVLFGQRIRCAYGKFGPHRFKANALGAARPATPMNRPK
jgi:hypothetical protein